MCSAPQPVGPAMRNTGLISLFDSEGCELRVQIRQGFAQNCLVSRILCVLKIPDHAGAGHEDTLFLAKQVESFLAEHFRLSCGAAVLGHVDLRLDRLTFPTSGHVFILRPLRPNGKDQYSFRGLYVTLLV